MVKSNQIYSPQNYLELVTGKCYIIRGANDIETIECVLEDDEYNLRSYPLTTIDHIVENNLDVVLVDCMVENEITYEFEHVYRWFEVPENIIECQWCKEFFDESEGKTETNIGFLCETCISAIKSRGEELTFKEGF